MERKLRFQFNSRHFYRAYVEVLKPFLKDITSREADVFSELLYYNWVKRDIPNIKDRFKIILDGDIRKEITSYLKISDAIFRNCLSKLRKRELLKEDGTIADVYLVIPTKGKFTITFEFNVNDNGKSL